MQVHKASSVPIIAQPGKKVRIRLGLEDDLEKEVLLNCTVKRTGTQPRCLEEVLDGMRVEEIRKYVLPLPQAKKYGIRDECLVELLEVKENFPDIELKVDIRCDEAECKGAILFMHGWPDDENIFLSQREACLEANYKCMYYTLPWFGPKEEAFRVAKERNYRNYGYEHHQLVDSIALRAYKEVGDGAKFSVVAHDWGAYHSQMLRVRHPHLVQRTVQVDVDLFYGAHFPTLKTFPRFVVLGLIYMYMLVWGHYLSQINFPPFSSLADWLNYNRAKSLYEVKDKDRVRKKFGSGRQGYVYTKYRKDVFRRIIGVKGSEAYFCLPGETKKENHAKRLFENTLFVYGEDKRFMFHSGKFAKKLNSESEFAENSAAVGVKAFHWVSLDCPDELSELILNYMENPTETCAEIKLRYRKP